MEKNTSEIAKLAERIAKDPKSKLFVPLAEEHKKAGDIETAVQVLMEGLKNNPSYVTARSFLGRLLMEQGDLVGAQKELEEVIKAIPDNLLAQRKLGDIYVLQGRPGDAVHRYKAALALNPGDKELPSLVADIGAGKDVSSRIPHPKPPVQPAAAKTGQSPAPPVQPKAPDTASARPVVPSALAPKAPAPSPQPPAKPAPAPQAASSGVRPASPAPAAAAVAPIQASPPPTPPAATAAPAPDEAELIEDIVHIEAFDLPAAAPSISEPVRAESSTPLPEAASFDLSEAPAAPAEAEDEAAAPLWGAEETMAAVETVSAAPAADASGDDLNTNTLAELYISQGFYDKSLEIYQGMLTDQPANKALQQKIERLKEMAGAQEASAAQATPVNAGAREYTPPPAETVAKTAMPAPAQKAEPAPAAPAPATTAGAPLARAAQTASARRKETIDRLESWLKNVSKEKP